MSKGLHPFKQLVETLPGLKDAVTTFTNLANKTVDLNAVTDRAFQPAVANWDGICSAELRDLPTHPKKKAEDAGSDLAWTAIALQFWISKVEQFNEAAANLEESVDRAGRHDYYATGQNGARASQSEIHEHKANFLRNAHAAYQSLIDNHLDPAAHQTAGMFKHPFSEENLQLARDAGAIPATPGAFSVFPAFWHRTNMTADAAEAQRLVNDLTSDGSISDEKLKRLAELMKADGADPVFAFNLLNAIGPDKLLQLNGDVALQTHSFYDLGDVDRDKASWIGAIQIGLGVALATATRPGNTGNGQFPPGHYTLQWTDDLIRAGKKTFELDTPDGFNRFYGYQLMAPLLEHGNYSPEVLAKIGGSMIDFERDHHGSEVWWNEAGDRKHFMDSNIRLDWSNGYGHHDPAGFDPMNALANALNHNAQATREVFAPEAHHEHNDPNAPIVYYSSDRLNYMLADRTWLLDLPAPSNVDFPSEDWHAVRFGEPGLGTLGQALEHATTRTFDQNEVALASATVHAVARSDHMAPELTKPMANLATVYIYEINRGVAPQFAGPAPGHGAVFSHNDTVDFLRLVGSDREANATIRAAEAKWAGDNYLDYLGGPDAQGNNADRILHTQQTSSLYGKVAGLLDSELDAQYRERVTAGGGNPDSAQYRIGSFLLDEGLDKVKDEAKEVVPAVPPIVVDAASELIKEGYAHIFGGGEKSGAELEAQIRHHTMNTVFHGQDLSASLASNAIYESGILTGLPAQYYVDGHLKPMSQFTPDDWLQWQGGIDPQTGNVVRGYINGGGQGANGNGEDANVLAQQAADAYMDGYNQAKNM